MNETLIKQRQALQQEIAELTAQLNTLNSQIIQELGTGFNGDIAGYHVNVSTRSTFKPAIATQIMDRRKITKKDRAALYKEPALDPTKVKVMYPDVYKESCVVSDPFVVVKG